MILKIAGTSNGNVLIDNIAHITRIGVTFDLGETVELVHAENTFPVTKEKKHVTQDIVSLYNLNEGAEGLHVFNLVIRSNVDSRKEFKTVIFRGPGFLMNDTGHTMETYLPQDAESTIVEL